MANIKDLHKLNSGVHLGISEGSALSLRQGTYQGKRNEYKSHIGDNCLMIRRS